MYERITRGIKIVVRPQFLAGLHLVCALVWLK